MCECVCVRVAACFFSSHAPKISMLLLSLLLISAISQVDASQTYRCTSLSLSFHTSLSLSQAISVSLSLVVWRGHSRAPLLFSFSFSLSLSLWVCVGRYTGARLFLS